LPCWRTASPASSAGAAMRNTWWRSAANPEASVRPAPRGECTTQRHISWIAFSRRYPCGSGW
jgi:hypothetical protein